MQLIERNVDLVGSAVVGCNRWLSPAPECNIIVVGDFQEKSRHNVSRKYERSDPLSSHLCPYPER